MAEAAPSIMIKLVLTSTLAQQFTDGQRELEVRSGTVRQLMRDLEAMYPGLGKAIENAMGLVIDGEFHRDPFMERLDDGAEVFVLPKIEGG